MQKKLISQLSALFFCVTACAQIKITNRDAMHPDSSLLFAGITNNIEVTGPSQYDLRVKAGIASIARNEANKFYVKVQHEQPVILEAFSSDKKKPVSQSQLFRSELIRPFEIGLAGSEETLLTATYIIANPFLTVIIPKSQLRHHMSVTGFHFATISGTDTLFTENYQPGNRLTPVQLDQIRKLSSGDKLYFFEIRATAPDSRAISFPPLLIQLR
jgi:hypothetical protein